MESPFREPTPKDLKVIETFGFRPDEGFIRLDRHLRRLAATCSTLGISCDLEVCRQKLAVLPISKSLRVRLTVSTEGEVEVTSAIMAPAPDKWRIGVYSERLRSADPWLQVKTTKRALYNQAKAELPDGIDEYIFLNENDEVCEGTITNIFVDFGEGLVTPPTSCGLLPGILRDELLEGDVRTEIIPFARLKTAKWIFVGNSLRGLIPAYLV